MATPSCKSTADRVLWSQKYWLFWWLCPNDNKTADSKLRNGEQSVQYHRVIDDSLDMTIAEAWIAIKAIVCMYSYRKHFYVIVILDCDVRLNVSTAKCQTHTFHILSSVIVKFKKKNCELRIYNGFDYHGINQARFLSDRKAVLDWESYLIPWKSTAPLQCINIFHLRAQKDFPRELNNGIPFLCVSFR